MNFLGGLQSSEPWDGVWVDGQVVRCKGTISLSVTQYCLRMSDKIRFFIYFKAADSFFSYR